MPRAARRPTHAALRRVLQATHTRLEVILEIPRIPRRARELIERQVAAIAAVLHGNGRR